MKSYSQNSKSRLLVLNCFMAFCFLPFVGMAQESNDLTYTEELASRASKHFSAEVNYNWNTWDLLRRSYVEYPELALKYRFINYEETIFIGGGLSSYYYTTDLRSDNFSHIDLQPHVFVAFKIFGFLRPWISLGDNITKIFLPELPEPQPGITVTRRSDQSVFHRVNTSSGLAIDIGKTFYIQGEVDNTFYVHEIKSGITELRRNVHIKFGLGARF